MFSYGELISQIILIGRKMFNISPYFIFYLALHNLMQIKLAGDQLR